MPTPEENAAAVAAATGYVQTPLTAEQQQFVDVGNNRTNNVLTTGESQATSSGDQPAVPVFTENQVNRSLSSQDDAVQQAPTSGGVGSGTSSNAFESKGADDNPGPNTASTQQSLAVFKTNQLIQTQPNQLDQYASYTYGISWYLLTPTQYNNMVKAQKANVSGWQLLMQSAGAPIKGRSPAFPDDYYMDDIEIDSNVMGSQNMANTATKIRFKVVEPNGITLIEKLFQAVKSAYRNAQQPNTGDVTIAKQPTTTSTPNYLTAQYCLVVQFYGYDVNGNLVAPAKGSNTGTYGQQAVITKYYPFIIDDLTFQIANRAVEYQVTGKPIMQWYNNSTDRGTIPINIALTGQTVAQLLVGGPTGAKNNESDPGARQSTPIPNIGGSGDLVPPTLPSLVTGQDNPLATSDGMDFTAGNF